MDGRKMFGVSHCYVVGPRSHQTSQARSTLRVTQYGFPLLRIGEKFRYPRNGGRVFHRHTSNSGAATNQKLKQRVRMARGERGKGVDQDAPKQDAPAAKEVRQVTSEQAENATNCSWDVEK